MRTHFALSRPNPPGEWGLSVATMPGATEDEILKAAKQLRQSHYRVASAGDLWEINGDPLKMTDEQRSAAHFLYADWDHNAHGLLLTMKEPTLELAAQIADLFGPAKVNPFYDERKRSHAGR